MSQQSLDVSFINGLINSTFHQAAYKLGLTDSEMSIFYVIARCGEGCNQSELYKTTGMRKSTINSAIRKMEKENLLYLKQGEGRNTRVYLTEKGRVKSKATVEHLLKIEQQIFSSWPEEEQSKFLELSTRFFCTLRDETNNL